MRSVRARGLASPCAVAALLVLPSAAAAQHIAAPARGSGVQVPPAFQQRIQADPTAFRLPNGLFRIAPDGGPMLGEQLGAKRMIVIPALFADSPEPHVGHERIREVLFDGPSPRGTLTEAYDEMSRGLFRVGGDVVPWVRTSLTRAEVVGASDGLGVDARTGEYLVEALRLTDAAVDFGVYDNDGPDGLPNSGDDDGLVDAIAFEFIEVAASCGGPGIWPHLWGIAPQNDGRPYDTDDLRPDGSPVGVNAYIVQSAVDCGGTEPQGASVIAHELGHVLGLPDYYHATAEGSAGRRWVLGCWDLMAAGSWGCGPHVPSGGDFGPTHLSARSKESLGWLRYLTVPEVRDTTIVLEPVQATGEALRIPLDDVGREFLLVEFRARTGFDRDLPSDGVLIYHQDFQGWLRPPPEEPGRTYFLSVVEQDADGGLLRNSYEGGDRGSAGDAWGVGGRVGKLNGETTPGTQRNDGTRSPVAFHSIAVEDGRALLRLSTARTPEIVDPGAPLSATPATPFEGRLRIAGGTMPYVVYGSAPEGLELTAEQDELVVAGSVAAPGPFELRLSVTDALGTTSDVLVLPLATGPLVVEERRLLQAFLRSSASPLTTAERGYLDYVGNRNGFYDVGDLRARLRGSATGGG